MPATAVPSRTGPLATAFVVVATTGATLFAVLAAGGSGTLEQSTVRLLYDVPAAAAIAAWMLVAAWRPTWLPSSRLMPAIVVILAAFAVTTVTSRSPRLSLEMLGYAVLLAELYLLLVALMRHEHLRGHFGRLALALCLLVCVLYLLQVVEAWQAWWAAVGHLALPPMRPAYLGLSLGSPNPIATLVLLLGAFGLACVWRAGRATTFLGALLTVVLVVVTVITGSRGAWLGAGAALVICGTVAVIAWPEARARVQAFVSSRRGALVAVLGFVALIAAAVFAARSGRLTLGDDGYREAFWAASLRMFRSSPLVGVGPGVWQVLRASYETASEPDLYIPHAHNIYLQTLAEFGLLGVGAGAVVVACLARLVRGAIESSDARRTRVGMAALFGIVLFAGQQLVDMLMNVPALLVAIALPLAWLDATAEQPVGSSAPPDGRAARLAANSGRLLALGGVALTLVILAGLLRIEGVAATSEQAASDADAGRWAQALAPARQAAAADPAVTSYQFELGIIAADAGDLPLASSALQAGATADDYPYAWLDLAAVRWRMGDLEGTGAALTQAERLGWQRAPLALAAGWLREQLGDGGQAVADDAAAIVAAPTLANDPYWQSTAALRGMWPQILAAAHAQVARSTGSAAAHAATLFTLDLIAGNAVGVSADLLAMTPVDQSLATLVVPAWNGVPGAEARLQVLAEDHPLEPGPVGWCQLVAAKNSELALVDRYGVWIGQGVPPVDRVTFGRPMPLPGGLDRYGSLYRRLVPAAQIVEILPQIAYADQF
jgi:O-antigen ligase/tetratricopeptide (TPR) repeat protein